MMCQMSKSKRTVEKIPNLDRYAGRDRATVAARLTEALDHLRRAEDQLVG